MNDKRTPTSWPFYRICPVRGKHCEAFYSLGINQYSLKYLGMSYFLNLCTVRERTLSPYLYLMLPLSRKLSQDSIGCNLRKNRMAVYIISDDNRNRTKVKVHRKTIPEAIRFSANVIFILWIAEFASYSDVLWKGTKPFGEITRY